ncbi:MAG: SHOCT domain-containing protein [Rubrobacteraceae bacterium]
MDFKDQEIDFHEADRRYAELKQQRAAGTISDEEFAAQHQQLMVLDEDGRWWAKSRESGEWRYHNGSTWVPGTPPNYEPEVLETPEASTETDTEAEAETSAGATRSSTQSTSPPKQASSPSSSKVAGPGGRKMPMWIPIVGLGGLALIALVIFFGVLLPALFGGGSGEQGGQDGEQAQGGQGGGQAQEGIVFDAVFTHRANPDNIDSNSTYIDDPLTNDDPDAILQVTQNWNPNGDGGTYNDHPIGVWYDSSRSQWAIFNQDREAMPPDSAFNVSVLKDPQQE